MTFRRGTGRLFDALCGGSSYAAIRSTLIMPMRLDASFWQRAEGPHAGRRPGATGSPAGPGAFAVTPRDIDPATALLVVEGELDLATAPGLKWALGDLIDAGRSLIVVDLSAVSFIDSTALGVLVGARRSMGAGGRIAIVCTNESVLKIFELTGLEDTFGSFATPALALAHLRGSAAATG